MAYTLRDIIKQRTGEIATGGNIKAPTIYKFRLEDEWQISYDIVEIGTFELSKDAIDLFEVKDKLPINTYIKQVGSNVKRVSYINIENGIIPPNIFKYAINVENFKYLFNHNTSFLIKEIPGGLFNNCINADDFIGAFQSCANIKFIPENLFANNIKAKNFDFCFSYCVKLEEVPENLFVNCTEANSFSNTFRDCTKLKEIPTNIFKNNKKITSIINCFLNCKSAWNYRNINIWWRVG